MAPVQLPLNVQTLYADLAQKLADPPRALPGSLSTKTLRSRKYLYVSRTEPTGRRQESLGPADQEETQAKADLIRRESLLARDRRNTIGMLKRAGLAGPLPIVGQVLDIMSRAGLFDHGLVLVGTAAFQTYSAVTGYRLPGAALMTQDADFVAATTSVSMATDGLPGAVTVDAGLLALLQRADPSFRAAPQIDALAPPSRFIMQNGFQVELLTPVRRRNEKSPVPLPAIGAGAIPMQFLEYLVEEAMPAVLLHGSGVRVTVPRPQRFAVHKLIVAQPRAGGAMAKKGKDLMQAAALIEILQAGMPDLLADALADAAARGPSWTAAIKSSLRELGLSLPF